MVINPTRVISRKTLVTAMAKGCQVTKDGMTVDLKDGHPPVTVPKDLVEDLTGQKMPKMTIRCKRSKQQGKAVARRKQAKASRRRNR